MSKHDPTPSDAPSVTLRVVEAVADAENVPAEELSPMGTAIDLEALESLVASAKNDVHVTWTVDGHRVSVDGAGTVEVF